MAKRPFPDTRTPALQQEYPRTHGDNFTEAAAEATGERYIDPIDAKAAGSVAIHGADQVIDLVSLEQLEANPDSNVISISAHRSSR